MLEGSVGEGEAAVNVREQWIPLDELLAVDLVLFDVVVFDYE